MTVTVRGTDIVFADGSTQTSAALAANAAIGTDTSSTLTLTNTSGQYQVFKPTSYTNSVVNLPDATTCVKGLPSFVIDNRSPIGANVTIKNASGTVVGAIPQGTIALVALLDNSTSAGQWRVSQTSTQNAVVGYDANSIALTSNSPTPTGNYGIVGLSSTTFVRWWVVWLGTGTVTFYLYTQVGTISGSTISFGSTQNSGVFSRGTSANMAGSATARVIRLSSTSFAVHYAGSAYYTQVACSCWVTVQTVYNYVNVNTVSGTTVTFGVWNNASMPQYGTFATIPNTANAMFAAVSMARLSDTSFALAYNDSATESYAWPYNYSGSMSCQIITVSGTTLTVGTKVQLSASTYSHVNSLVALSSSTLLLCYTQAASAGSNIGRTKLNVISVSGTVPTFGSSATVESTNTTAFAAAAPVADGAVAPSATLAAFNAGYFTGVATISGTTPTIVAQPYQNRIGSMYLSGSSRAIAPLLPGTAASYAYLDISTGGFVLSSTQASTNQVNAGFTTSAAIYANPLGAQPTTSFIAANSATDIPRLILGTTT